MRFGERTLMPMGIVTTPFLEELVASAPSAWSPHTNHYFS